MARTPLWLQFRWQAAAIAGLVLAAYLNSLDGSFQFDDWSLINDPYVRARDFGWGVFRLMQTRPLTYWTFHLNFLASPSPFGFHLVNLLLHAANAVLLFWVVQRFLKLAPQSTRAAAQTAARTSLAIAFLAAAFFAVHPLQTEAVSYVFERASVLSTFFALLCFALFQAGRYGWSVLAFAASLAAKEEALALPAFLFLYDYLFGDHAAAPRQPVSGWPRIARRAWYYATLLALDALAAGRLFYVIRHTKNAGVGFAVKDMTPLTYALTQARVIWRYLRLVVAPYGQNLNYDFALSRSLLSPWTTLPAVVLLLALIGWLSYLALRRRGWAFAALGFFILLSPSSSFVPQSDVIFEHRAYLPMIGLAMAAGWLLVEALRRVQPREMRLIVAIALIGMCFGLTIARNQVWVDEATMGADVVQKSPNKARVYIGYARGLIQQRKSEAALRAIERGLALEPEEAELNMNLGVMLLSVQPQRAYGHFERALKAGYSPIDCLSNMGAALLQMRQLDRAADILRQALVIDPCSYNARYDLMMALALGRHKQEAIEVGRVPSHCRLLPEQADDLRKHRAQLESE